MQIALDMSRLISRVRHERPSGVDRVEMAYARGLLARHGADLEFAAVHPTRKYGRIQRETALSYLDLLEERWSDPAEHREQRSVASVLGIMAKLLPSAAQVGSADVIVQASPHHLHQFAQQQRIIEREQARFVCMVHDLIPIEYPEYARPGGASLHALRMTTVSKLADAVIVNSEATGASFRRWVEARGETPPDIHVALLGTEVLPKLTSITQTGRKPYFVCVGTIEPRKNHLLLLHQWRHMAQSLPGQDIPQLKVIGRRGWENEQIVDLLERSPALAPYVDEINGCSDQELAELLSGACGLLMPSFAEGYGMPIAEALAAGTPVIASDIAAHREAGGTIPDYISPLDGPEWQEAIIDFAADGPKRRAQIARLEGWNPPDWDAHLDIVSAVLESVAS